MKESKWDMPDELLLVLENVEKDGQADNRHQRESHLPVCS